MPRFTALAGREEAGTVVAETAGILQREKARALAVVLRPGSLGCHVTGRRVLQIPQYLPADGGSPSISQPVTLTTAG
jgi:hypothetical protein